MTDGNNYEIRGCKEIVKYFRYIAIPSRVKRHILKGALDMY